MDAETKRLLLVVAALAVNLNALAVMGERGRGAAVGARAWLLRLPRAVVVAVLAPLVTFALTSFRLGMTAWDVSSLPGVLLCDAVFSFGVAAWVGLPLLLWFAVRDPCQRPRLQCAALALLPLTVAAIICVPERPRRHHDALIRAIERHDLAAVRAELDRGADPKGIWDFVSEMHEGDAIPLNVAVETGDRRVVALHLDRGADCYQSGDSTAVDAALEQDDLPMVRLLLFRAKDGDTLGREELNAALRTAAINDRAEIVNFLLDEGADPNTRAGTKTTGETLLRQLVVTGKGKTGSAALLSAAGGHE